MARIDHRTALYNTTANPAVLSGFFATSYGYEDRVVLPADYQLSIDKYPRARFTITRFDRCRMPALAALMAVFRRTREWYQREVNRSDLHPVILKMFNNPEQAQYLTDWREMVLEYPHVADTDNTKISYTESDVKGIADRQTVTSLGKYLKRHAPTMPDHILRDIVALSVTSVELVFDLAGMVNAVQTGPASCMQSAKWDTDSHPYNVYDPQYGWHMAVRKEAGAITGRCLCLTHNNKKLFVRSYRTNPNNGYSQSDEGMNAWLVEHGYTHKDQWPEGAQLTRIMHSGDLVLPYIDGGESHCYDRGDYLIIDSTGDYDGCQTDGYAEMSERTYCEDCMEAYNADDEGAWTGAYEDHRVCGCCMSNYTEVIGRRGNTYYLSDDFVLCETDDQYYHINYLDYNDIVYIESVDGYYHKDYCTQLTDTGDWILTENRTDDDYVCLDYDADSYALRENCWQCAGSERWYISAEHTPVIAEDGLKYHEGV